MASNPTKVTKLIRKYKAFSPPVKQEKKKRYDLYCGTVLTFSGKDMKISMNCSELLQNTAQQIHVNELKKWWTGPPFLGVFLLFLRGEIGGW